MIPYNVSSFWGLAMKRIIGFGMFACLITVSISCTNNSPTSTYVPVYTQTYTVTLTPTITNTPTITPSPVATMSTPIGSQGSGNGKFSSPTGLALDGSGNLYVGDGGNSRLQEITTAGVYEAQWGSACGGCVTYGIYNSIAVNSAGSTLYVWNISNTGSPGLIFILSNSLGSSASFGSQGTGNGQFQNYIYGLAVDASGNVYATDYGNNRVQKFDYQGNYLNQWGAQGTGTGKFNGPTGIAVDSQGNIYVSDGGNKRVEKFDSGENYVTQWGSPGTADAQFGGYGPGSVAVDGSNNVYVTDWSNSRIEKYSSAGAYIGQFNANTPWGIAVDSSGNVYAANISPPQIDVY
jgi:sugar lactone lactonase YvrE